jgi:hypothetical protein
MKNVQTIQLTAKVFKGQKVLAVILALVGLTMMTLGHEHGAAVAMGALTLTLSIVWFYTVKILIWWHHA